MYSQRRTVIAGEERYYWGLGTAPSVGSRGKASGQGFRGTPPEADDILANKIHIWNNAISQLLY